VDKPTFLSLAFAVRRKKNFQRTPRGGGTFKNTAHAQPLVDRVLEATGLPSVKLLVSGTDETNKCALLLNRRLQFPASLTENI
jgi:hypothetical protein